MTQEVIDAEVMTEVRSILATHETNITKKCVTHEQAAASVKAAEDKMAELIAAATAAQESKTEARFKDEHAAAERLIKERTARLPAVLGGPGTDAELRSVGNRLVDTAEFKTWAASDQRGKFRLQLAVKGRLEMRAAGVPITEAGSGYPILPVRVGAFGPPFLPLRMRDLLNVVPITNTNAIEYVQEAWNLLADYQVAEGDLKAQSDVAYTDKTVMVRNIAHYVKVSRQMLADAPYFASTVDGQLLYGVARKEDHEILHGDNAAGHLWGILPQATALPATTIAGILYSADQVAAAIAYLVSIGFAPTAIVLNPLDWASMQIAKTAQGVYILGGPPAANAPATLWGLPVVTTGEMTAGTFLVGAFPPNATLYDREAATVEIAYENEDDFIRNMVTMRCEERIALAVFRPQAFVTGSVTPPVVPFGAAAQSGSSGGSFTKDKK